MKEQKKILIDALGDGAIIEGTPTKDKPIKNNYLDNIKKLPTINPDELDAIQTMVNDRLSRCATNRDIIELEVTSLAECVGIATEIYRKNPVPDFAYQLASLSNAHKATLQQLEKMKDPKVMVGEIEFQIRNMFMGVVKAMAVEIDKTKREMVRLAPEHKNTLEDLFSRMLNAIQPETQNIYDNLQKNLKRTMGIKV